MICKHCHLEIKLIGENYYAKRFNPDFGHVCTSNDSGKHEPAEPVAPVQKNKQREIDISNLRFYARMAKQFEWGTDVIHWNVVEHTLNEIADSLIPPQAQCDKCTFNGCIGDSCNCKCHSEGFKQPTAPADSTPQNITCICGVTFRQDDLGTRQLHEECPKQRFINDSCPACGSKQHFHACPHRQKLNLQPEATSTRTEMPPSVMDDHKGVQAAKKWMQELLGHVGIGHITYACFEDKSGKGWSVPQLLDAYLSHLAASVQQEPLSAEPDPWKRIKQQWIEIGNLKQALKEHVAKIRNQREEINRLQAAAPRTQGSERVNQLASEIADKLAEKGFHRDCGNNNRLVIEHELETMEEFIELAAQPQPAPCQPDHYKNAANKIVLQAFYAYDEAQLHRNKVFRLSEEDIIPTLKQFFTASPAQKEEE